MKRTSSQSGVFLSVFPSVLETALFHADSTPPECTCIACVCLSLHTPSYTAGIPAVICYGLSLSNDGVVQMTWCTQKVVRHPVLIVGLHFCVQNIVNEFGKSWNLQVPGIFIVKGFLIYRLNFSPMFLSKSIILSPVVIDDVFPIHFVKLGCLVLFICRF